MTTSTANNPIRRPIHRELFLELLRTASFMDHTRFARQAALDWLAAFPGDIPVQLSYTQLLLKAGLPEQALPLLEKLCLTDPEYLEAAVTRLEVELKLKADAEFKPKVVTRSRLKSRHPSISDTMACVHALGGSPEAGLTSFDKAPLKYTPKMATWSQNVRQARQALGLDQNAEQVRSPLSYEEAETNLHASLVGESSTPLLAVTHLRLVRERGTPLASLHHLAEHYHKHWPDCLQFSLILAETLIDRGEMETAVAMLHQCAARDVTGQVARRLWGETNPYRSLWPDQLETYLDVPIPASVAAAMGWNQLPEGPRAPIIIPTASPQSGKRFVLKSASGPSDVDEQVALPDEDSLEQDPGRAPSDAPVPEMLLSIQAELDRFADQIDQPGLARSDGRYPVYVVMTTHQGLEERYGAEGASRIESAIGELVVAIDKRPGWRGMGFYPDRSSLPGVEPARFDDPWALKLALTDLDAALARKGQMIAALLIVGGPGIVPFHHLPNPVDDADDDVASDNPYGTRDENYFIPEWPVGRLPGGASKDIQTLLHALHTLTDRHGAQAAPERSGPWYRRWWNALLARFMRGSNKGVGIKPKRRSFGFSAAVWRRTSTMVFHPIGEPRDLRISPPAGLEPTPLPSAQLGYFNLHGLVDAVEWYGQSEEPISLTDENESAFPDSGFTRDYPVAIRPADVVNSGRAPQVVFSEACYGAHILGKTVEESLALKFLEAGSQAVVGSTCTAYGSISTPLTAADFLGHAFWSYLKRGDPAGEALRKAKIALAREMHHRQGYLDGEDQKTLISFVLYGDPLAQPLGIKTGPKAILRPQRPVNGIKTVCDRATELDLAQPVPQEVLEQVKNIVEQYLPGMQGAQVSLCQEHFECKAGDHCCPTSQLTRKSGLENPTPEKPGRRVVVLSKQVAGGKYTHPHYARLTLDEGNRLVKLVVSR